jgi:hypothetical protein
MRPLLALLLAATLAFAADGSALGQRLVCGDCEEMTGRRTLPTGKKAELDSVCLNRLRVDKARIGTRPEQQPKGNL